MFPCKGDSPDDLICISELQFCDGVSDCPNGSDEPSSCLKGTNRNTIWCTLDLMYIIYLRIIYIPLIYAVAKIILQLFFIFVTDIKIYVFHLYGMIHMYSVIIA